MAALRTLLSASLVLLLSATAISCAQSSLDISLPSSYHINTTRAYDSSNNAVSIWGSIDFVNYANGIYAAIPTDAPEGDKLAFFQDTGSWALFRNNTLFLPVDDAGGRVASLVFSTDNMVCDNGAFYGPVTGIELDTKALGDGDAMAGAVIYLGKWPDRPLYHISINGDGQVKQAVMAGAAKDGQAGSVKLMLDVSGDSVGYVIVHMKAPEAAGNVSAYRYRDGNVTRLSCMKIQSNDSVVYETISSGGGTFAFVGDFPEPAPVRAGLRDVLSFSGVLGVALLLLVGSVVIAFKKLSKIS